MIFEEAQFIKTLEVHQKQYVNILLDIKPWDLTNIVLLCHPFPYTLMIDAKVYPI